MYNGLFTACDSCATPVDGKVGTAQVKKGYIELQGNILKVVYSQKYEEGKTFWAKRRDDITRLAFCDTTCLSNFLDAKIEYVERRIEEKGEETSW